MFEDPDDDPSGWYLTSRHLTVHELLLDAWSVFLTCLATFWTFSDLPRLHTHRDTALNTSHTRDVA